MQQQVLLVFDCDPAGGAAGAVCSILKSPFGSVIKLKYESCMALKPADVAQCIGRAVSQSNPSLVFLTFPLFLQKEHELLVQVLEQIQVPVIAIIKEGDSDGIFALLKLGVAEYLTPPFDAHNILPRIRRLLSRVSDQQQSHALSDIPDLNAMVGKSPAFVAEISKIPPIAKSEAYVLITGETGTGKELFARAIHDLSTRARGPYIAVNCGAIPTELVENELFGHKRGAFTGAGSHQSGLVEAAHGGTLFLDEVNSLPMAAQAKLLRFLQEKEYRPLGSSTTIKADVRVVSAANVDVEEAVNGGQMRRDLYYRLNVMTIKLPPLRDRREDIPLLANYFLRGHGANSNGLAKEFTEEAMHMLMLYEWPGNVRELEHIVERAIVLCEQRLIGSAEILRAVDGLRPRSFRDAKMAMIEEFERDYFRGLLHVCGGNLTKAARIAQIDKSNLRRLIKKHLIDSRRFRKEPGRKRSSQG
jgi:two-component system, NtrC family, response regulator GlrR